MDFTTDVRPDEIMYYGDTDLSDPKILLRHPYIHRRSPIMVTLADAKTTVVDIQKMMELGMNVVRIKMAYNTTGNKIKLIKKIEKAAAYLCEKHSIQDWPITTCAELKTCIVRTGLLEGNEHYITLKEGSFVTLTYNIGEFDKCNASKIFVDNPYLAVDVKVGMLISICQDKIVMRCKKIINDTSIRCIVTKSGNLRSMNIVSVSGGVKTRPLLTNKDLEIIKFVLEYKIDMIIINYARQVETLRMVKQYIKENISEGAKRPILLCGICTANGLKNVDELIKESDGIVFSREFLVYELEESFRFRLLRIQKWVGAKCQQNGKPFYISEVFKGALTYGEFYDNESVDVTNAIIDGATGFILKDSPDVEMLFEVLKELNTLCCSIEPLTNSKTDFWRIMDGMRMPITAAEACAMTCATVANQTNSRAIIIPTVSGQAAKTLMWLRPACVVLTVSSKPSTTRRLQSYRCVIPLMYQDVGICYKNWYESVEARVRFAVDHATRLGWLNLGDNYVTLQRGSEDSAFCDTVRSWVVTVAVQTTLVCDDPYERKTSTRFSKRMSGKMYTQTNLSK